MEPMKRAALCAASVALLAAFCSGAWAQSSFTLTVVKDAAHTQFRVDTLGHQYWTAVQTVPDVLALTFEILFADSVITVQKTYLTETLPLVGINTYLFTGGGSYLGQSAQTDSNGEVRYSVPAGSFKVRADWLTKQLFSATFDKGESRTIAFAQGKAEITFMAGGQARSGVNVIEERDQSNSVIATYVFGQGMDDILAIVRGGSRYYYVRDAHGNVAALTDSSGDVIERYRYGEYGEVTFLDTTGTEKTVTSSDYGNPLLFQARNFDSETGLYYFRARYYSPALGRFLSHDPNGFADSMNLYQYCLENPINLSDPSGEILPILIGAAIGLWAYTIKTDFGRSPDYDLKEHLLWGLAGATAGAVGYGAAAGVGGYLAVGGKSLGAIAAGSGASAWASTAGLTSIGGLAGGLAFQGSMDMGHWKFSGVGATWSRRYGGD